VNRRLPVWNDREYAERLSAQDRGQLVQVVAWIDAIPVGRGMVLFPEHDEFSTSAVREGSAEVRDVFVARARRRLGVATAIMAALEEAARERGMLRVGLAVALDEEAAPARALYDGLGYRHAHGPFVSSSSLAGDDGPIAVGAVMDYLVKDL
jgi:GNAT superfamily N-acetyltransferase